ncbi:MAG: PLD nuclease N-terminal domain-containing protein [Candidatus Nanopelagicales bacterium]|jgi:hypothetical protein|nr:PLD nuclease N-terminal domain-containing protein [Candidatus Nanopelagicales bacterium]
MKSRRKWSDLTSSQQQVIIVGALLEAAITTVALIDLARRPRAQVRGPKAAWALGCFIQPVGPIAYLALGRRSAD